MSSPLAAIRRTAMSRASGVSTCFVSFSLVLRGDGVKVKADYDICKYFSIKSRIHEDSFLIKQFMEAIAAFVLISFLPNLSLT